MSALFDLPDALCTELLSEWLCIRDVGLLDTSVCSNQWRFQLLKIITTLPGTFGFSDRIEYLHWINIREIRLIKLFADDYLTSSDWMTEISSHWKHLKSLVVSEFNGCTFGDRVYCPNLTSLKTNEADLMSWNGDGLSNLTDLEISSLFHDANPLDVVKVIQMHCRKLRRFNYQFTPTADTLDILLALLKVNTKLSSVSLE